MKNIGAMLKQRAVVSPQLEAYVEPSANVRMDYTQMNALANRCASVLTSLGVGNGDRVALLMPNCVEFCCLFYGAAKIGAVAVGSCPSHGVNDDGRRFLKSYQLSEGRTTPVSARVSPTDRIRGEIDALFDGSRDLSEVIEDVARLGARLIIQTAVEAEVDVFLGGPATTSCRVSGCPGGQS